MSSYSWCLKLDTGVCQKGHMRSTLNTCFHQGTTSPLYRKNFPLSAAVVEVATLIIPAMLSFGSRGAPSPPRSDGGEIVTR